MLPGACSRLPSGLPAVQPSHHAGSSTSSSAAWHTYLPMLAQQAELPPACRCTAAPRARPGLGCQWQALLLAAAERWAVVCWSVLVLGVLGHCCCLSCCRTQVLAVDLQLHW